MLINEVELDPFRIRYRLVGTKVQNILNINITGRYLDELVDGATKTPWMAYFASAFAGRQALMAVLPNGRRMVETSPTSSESFR
jgi:hypothetical protein